MDWNDWMRCNIWLKGAGQGNYQIEKDLCYFHIVCFVFQDFFETRQAKTLVLFFIVEKLGKEEEKIIFEF